MSGGATDGLLKVVNDGELNTNFGGDLRFHRLLKTGKVGRDEYSIDSIERLTKEVNNQFAIDTIKLNRDGPRLGIQKNIQKFEKEIADATGKIIELQKILSPRIRVDSAKTAIRLLEIDIDVAQVSIEQLKRNNFPDSELRSYNIYEEERLEQLKDDKLRSIKEAKLKLGLTSFDIAWLSLALNVSNNSFNYLNEPKSKDINFKFVNVDTSYISQKLTIARSRFVSEGDRSKERFRSIGFSISRNSNFKDLSSLTLESRRFAEVDSISNIVSTATAYSGKYVEDILQLTIFYDWITYIGIKSTAVGVRLYPELRINSESATPTANIAGGLILPLLNQDEQKSVLNIELFYRVNDMFNVLSNDQDNFLGLRLALPLNNIN